jgi:sugar phosphate isomerase/epimerase
MLKLSVVLAVILVFGAASLDASHCCSKTGASGGKSTACGAKGARCKLGTQAYTFKEFTLFEAIDKAKQLELEFVEIFQGQRLSSEHPDVKSNHEMPLSLIAKLKNKLDDAGVKALAYGVVKLGKDEAECRKIFDFAKVMGMTTITAEPPEEALPMIDKLANEYRINVAIHNHPKPSHYWNPETVLKAVQGRSKRIGACADTGHWVRSGLDPVECLKKLEGRVLWSHFKDLNEKDRHAHDVPWGTGVGNAKAQLAELCRQGFSGGISIEYEHNWKNSMPEIAKCVAFFRATCKELCAAKKK